MSELAFVRELLEGVADADHRVLTPILDADSVVVTGRSRHEGPLAIFEWASKRYEHLERRWRVSRVERVGDGMLADGAVEYLWRESGEHGDSQPAFFAIRFEGAMLRRLSFHDTRAEALAALRDPDAG